MVYRGGLRLFCEKEETNDESKKNNDEKKKVVSSVKGCIAMHLHGWRLVAHDYHQLHVLYFLTIETLSKNHALFRCYFQSVKVATGVLLDTMNSL